MSTEPSKAYSPAGIESRVYQLWLERGCFHADPNDSAQPAAGASAPKPPYSVVIPPPNVTGALHLGHAINNTLQDILVRRKRMQGCNTMWMPGVDHAGIATQAVVERKLFEEEKKTRHDLGREGLVQRIWDWKKQYGDRIVQQLKLMGCSCDWQRERFTLDDVCARAVREWFFRMFRDGLIFRGKRLVNWDTHLQTAVADDEVYHETVKGHLWQIRYPVLASDTPLSEHVTPSEHVAQASAVRPTLSLATIDAATNRAAAESAQPGRDYLVVATTRPETMLADTAVAVHPEDERYRHLIGKHVLLPLTGRAIPVIADGLLVKREFGTGCVKVTPGHDPNDYACYLRHPEIGIRNMMTPDGRVHDENSGEPAAGEPTGRGRYAGQKLDAARKQVVADIEAAGLLHKIEDYVTDVGHSDRSKTPIQPYLSDQWFVKMGDLTAEEAARVQSPHLRERIDASSNRNAASQNRDRKGADGADSAGQLPGLAQTAIDALCDIDAHYDGPSATAARATCDKVHIFPRRYGNTYRDWLSEKRDWCISRQLWWGHRIPVWSGFFRSMSGSVPRDVSNRIAALQGWLDRLDDATQSGGNAFVVCSAPEVGTAFFRVSARTERSAYQLSCVLDNLNCAQSVAPGQVRVLPRELIADPRDPRHKLLGEINELLCEIREQDPDVLDTWFSSALWPLSTMGWPQYGLDGAAPQAAAPAYAAIEPNLLAAFYPTSLLSTAREIITLWVARMVIAGLYNVGRVPFRDVFIHPVIQDGQGRQMKKSLGNGVDPVDIIDMYGADALRFTLAAMTTETQDVRVPVKKAKLPDGREVNTSEKFELGRNFCNKLWQAATGFILPAASDLTIERYADGYGYRHTHAKPGDMPLFDRWIRTRLNRCIREVDAALDTYQFARAADRIREFFWTEFCDWYLEESKLRLKPDPRGAGVPPVTDSGGTGSLGGTGVPPVTESQVNDTKVVLLQVLDATLQLLHPFVPFITEAIWAEVGRRVPKHYDLVVGDDVLGHTAPGAAVDTPLLIHAAWPTPHPLFDDERCDRAVGEILQPIILALRQARTDINAVRSKGGQPAVRTLPTATLRAAPEVCRVIETNAALIQRMGGVDALTVSPTAAKPHRVRSHVAGNFELYFPVADLIDLTIEESRLRADLAEKQAALGRASAQLANEGFVSRASPETVAETRAREAELKRQCGLIEQHLADLS